MTRRSWTGGEAVYGDKAHADQSKKAELDGRGVRWCVSWKSACGTTLSYDLKSSRLLWRGEGRAKETLGTIFEWFGKECTARIEGVCCEMWQPYIDVIKECVPQAVLVFDRFYILQYLARVVDRVRCDEIREKGNDHRALMAKNRYIWLKNPWGLAPHQQARLSVLEKLNLKINRAYLSKEAFREFWDYRRPSWTKRYLERWFWWTAHFRLQPMRDFAWMLRRHQKDLMSCFREPIHNDAVDGLNYQFKISSHKAYGFRTAKNYIRDLYYCMAALPLSKTMHTFVCWIQLPSATLGRFKRQAAVASVLLKRLSEGALWDVTRSLPRKNDTRFADS